MKRSAAAVMFLVGLAVLAYADGRLSPQGGTITGVAPTTGGGLTGGGFGGPVELSLLRTCPTTGNLEWSVAGWICSAAPSGYVKLDPYVRGTTDLSIAINAAMAALGSSGGTIDARNVNVSGHAFGSTITISKPITLLLGAGNYDGAAVTPIFNIVTTGFPAANLIVHGMDPRGTTITAGINGTIFKIDGDFYDYAGDGRPMFQVSHVTLDGNNQTGSLAVDASNTGLTLNFQDGIISLEDCTITRFKNSHGAVWIGPSVYFVRLNRNNFIDNEAAIWLDSNVEAAVTQNYFSQGPSTSSPTITSVGPMQRIVNNYFYRYNVADTSTQPDIQLLPNASWGSQAGGFVWILDNRFGGERENFNTARSRIRLYASDSTLIAGPAIIKGNQFLGPSVGISSVSAIGGVATVTLLTSGVTTGLVTGTTRVTISGSSVSAVNGTWVVTGKTATTFTFALSGTYSGGAGGQVMLADGHPISIENPSLAWDLSGNYFNAYGVIVNDAQPSIASAYDVGNSQFLDNRIAPPASGYRIFANEGRQFSRVNAQPGASIASLDGTPHAVESPSLINRLPASDVLTTWTTNTSSGSSVAVTSSQADPNGGTSAFLITIGGTGANQWIGQAFYTADLSILSRVTVKFWAKAGTLSSFNVGVTASGTTNFIGGLRTVSLSSTWKQYKLVIDGLPAPTTTTYQLLFYPGRSDVLAGSVSLWQPQVSDSDSDYLPNTNAYNVIAKAIDTVNGTRFQKGVLGAGPASFSGAVAGLTIATGFGGTMAKWTPGTGVPGIPCAVGDLFSRTDGGVGTSLYLCTATNTWTADGVGGGAVTSVGATAPISSSGGATPTIGIVEGNGITNSGGAIVVNNGTGLTFSSGTLTYDSSVIQSRLSGTCTSPNAIASVASNGTVTCTTGVLNTSNLSGTTGQVLKLTGPNTAGDSSINDGTTVTTTKAFGSVGINNSGRLVSGGTVTVTGINTTLTDYAPSGITTASILDITLSASIAVTGLFASQIAGQILIVRINSASGSFTANFVHQSTSSAGNQLRMANAANRKLRAGNAIILVYDGTSWVDTGVASLAMPALTVDGSTTLGGAQTDVTTIWGNTQAVGATPTLGANCSGTGTATIVGTNAAGTVTLGATGTITQCTINWAGTRPHTPPCVLEHVASKGVARRERGHGAERFRNDVGLRQLVERRRLQLPVRVVLGDPRWRNRSCCARGSTLLPERQRPDLHRRHRPHVRPRRSQTATDRRQLHQCHCRPHDREGLRHLCRFGDTDAGLLQREALHIWHHRWRAALFGRRRRLDAGQLCGGDRRDQPRCARTRVPPA
jgi:hypothetical protein